MFCGLRDSGGKPGEGIHSVRLFDIAVMDVVGTHFRPEFINRVDESVVFHPLEKAHMARIATIQFDVLKHRLADQEIDIALEEGTISALTEEGYDPVYGARPLKRVIQKRIENPLAQRILAGDFPPGSRVTVAFEDGEYVFGEGEPSTG